MMETLEQQQTKSTPNIEPHAGDTETTPAASEEDDFEDNSDAIQLEEKEKSKSPQLDEMKTNEITKANDVKPNLDLAIENGCAKEEPSEPQEVSTEKESSNSLDETLNCMKVEFNEEKESIAEEVPAVHEEKPSASHVPPVLTDNEEDDVKPVIDIKTEEKESSLHFNNCKSDESSPRDIKIVEDYESGDDETMDDTATCSPENKVSKEICSQDAEMIDELHPSASIKQEEAIPSPNCSRDNETIPSPVCMNNVTKTEGEQNNVDEISPVALTDSQDEDISSPIIDMVDQKPSSPAITVDGDTTSTSELHITEEVKDDVKNFVDDEETSPVYRIVENEISSLASPKREDLVTTPAAEDAVVPPTASSPVIKINDLSPASIPDDEESIHDFGAQPTVDAQAPMEVIKIESDSDVEVIVAKDEESTESNDKLPMETSIKMKINGAHAAMLQKLDADCAVEPQQMEVDGELKAEEEAEALQLSVIANNAVEKVQEQEQEREQEKNKCRLSSRSSSVSSTSQQLVIDHPESEHGNKQPQQQQQLVQSELQLEEQQLLQATKRRRSSSNDATVSNKQQRMEEPSSSSLLMQRLQAPASNCHELGKLLSCYKCNATSFDNFQQLNAHYTQCGQPTEEVAPGTPTAAEAIDIASNENSPAAAAAPIATPTPVSTAMPIKKERFFRCARCSTVHQCWNFFLHMREVHQRYICLYCSHVFASVEKLSLHLENKHDMDQRHFNNVEAWQTLQTQEDRARYLVCCNCQASFERGTQFDDHDCAELMQPCALCGQKAGHANGCRNGSSPNSRKKVTVRRKRRTAKSKQLPVQPEEQQAKVNQLEELPNWMDGTDAVAAQELPQPAMAMHENNNIPAPSEEVALPKLVVPKIMLRVPKEFQKSVDAALSSTDTEEEENDELPSTGPECSSPAPLLTVDAVHQQQQQLMLLPASNRSEDTETATETASMFLEATTMPANASVEMDDDDSSTDKLTLMVAELERTKRDIQRTKAHIVAKQEQQLQQQGQDQEQEQDELQLHQQQEQQQRRWSPTPPASPHNNHINEEKQVPNEQNNQQEMETETEPEIIQRRNSLGSDCMDIDESLMVQQPEQMPAESQSPVAPLLPADGIEVASEETHTVDLQLDRPLDKFEMFDFVRLCLMAVYPFCLYCNHARRIAVSAKQLVLHLIRQHRFTATVDSITAEELHAETIVSRLKSYLPALESLHFLNSDSCCSLEDGRFALPFNERIYECFQCRYVTATHKELYTHNRRLHTKAAVICTMCRINFYSYSELLCHICPGVTTSNIYDIQFRCCLCETTPTLPSAFRLMVHLRKQHQTCDICLEDCHTQAKLSSHVWKHKLLHLCYRCGIAYRNKQDISKHLFWKHGTESASCKRCLQKRWRHVYHFCIPATQFTCEHCQFSFSKAIYLEVHKREHSGDFRYACNEDECEEKFVSRRLLLKHAAQHEVKESPANSLDIMEGAQMPLDEERRLSRSASEQPEQDEQTKLEAEQGESSIKPDPVDSVEEQQPVKDKTPQPAEEKPKQQSQRKRRKKAKRNKASLEDLNLIAPNLSESDSTDETDSDIVGVNQQETGVKLTLPMRSSVDDLDMPRVMLSPASESDNEEGVDKKQQPETKQEQEELMKEPKAEAAVGDDDEQKQPKVEPNAETSQEVADIWKNLLQHQPTACGKTEPVTNTVKTVNTVPSEVQLRPSKLHVICSDHDYCKMQRTPPPPVPSPKKLSRSTPSKSKRDNTASSDSDSSSSSSSNSDSDSSSCSCGSNCSCSSSGSSSSDDESDNESTCSGNGKKAIKNSTEYPETPANHIEEDVNVTSVNEEEPRPATPTSKEPLYYESDFDTCVEDTDEEFYDAHPQKMANELLAQKRLALISAQAREQAPGDSSNYDIVENSRPSTPSLPEDATAFEDKRERVSKNKKRKRERKSTCKSASQGKFAQMPHADAMPHMAEPSQLLPTHLSAHLLNAYNETTLGTTASPAPFQQLMPDTGHTLTPLTHRPGGAWQPRMSEGSSCSDADGQLKRSKRTRRPNKFYGYTSDDENMSSVLAPPLQVGMQLIKPQPPPLLTWAKEDLPTPAKQQRSRNNHSDHHANHQHHNVHSNSNGNTRKRNKRTPLSGGSGSAKRSVKRVKQNHPQQQEQQQRLAAEQLEQKHLMPPIPTLKIRPALLPATSVGASDSSDSSSDDDDDDENAEINVTSLLPLNNTPRAPPTHHAVHLPPAAPPPAAAVAAPTPQLPVQLPPPPPATKAFNQPIPPALLPNPDFATLQYFKANNIRYPIRPPAGARLAREGESVYCYCRCPYDEVSEMIACDGDNCLIEWFHFECVGIMVAPQGKWFCAECRPKYSEGLYMGAKAK